MIYIYDILLNWTDVDYLYNFYEWTKGDTIEHIKRMPLVKVSKEIFLDFLNYKVTVSRDFIKLVKNMTEVFRNKKIETICYAACMSDGVKAIALEFSETGELIYHSTMLLDEEEDVIDLTSKIDFTNISYKTKKSIKNTDDYFTRAELDKKKFLIKEIEQAYKTDNETKLSYLYQEYFNETEDNVDLMYHKLVNSFTSFDEQHEKLYQLLKLTITKKQV